MTRTSSRLRRWTDGASPVLRRLSGPATPDPVDTRVTRCLRAAVAVLTLAGPPLVATLPLVGFGAGQASGWVAAFPLLASLVLRWRATAVAAANALVVAALMLWTGPQTLGEEAAKLALIASVSTFALANCVLRENRERRLVQMAEIARVAQNAILRPVPSRSGSISLATRYRSAAEAAAVGGDLVEVIPTERGVRLVLGDVRGKGLPAVTLASTVLASFRLAAHQPGLSLQEVARAVDHSVALRAGDEDFVTAVFIDVDERGSLEVINCGHPPPLRLAAGSEQLQSLDPAQYSTPLGLSPQLRADTFDMSPGDRVMVMTDGLLEARSAADAFFAPTSLTEVLASSSLEKAADGVVAAVERHTGGRLHDDMAFLLIHLDRRGTPDRRQGSDRRSAGRGNSQASTGRGSSGQAGTGVQSVPRPTDADRQLTIRLDDGLAQWNRAR